LVVAACLSVVGCKENADGNNANEVDSVSIEYVPEPLEPFQWYVENTYSEGYDLNVSGLEESGSGITVAVIDDGIELNHEDLIDGVANELHYNYVKDEPGSTAGVHGTAVAGIIGARQNGVGIRGIAPSAQLVSYNLTANYSVANEADALTRGLSSASIVNNSWGPVDGTNELHPIPFESLLAIQRGIEIGRDGLGLIYIWSAGNGGANDRSSYDGYVNLPYTVPVTSVNDAGYVATTSEEGANHWVSAFGEAVLNDDAILTTDLTGSKGTNDGYDPNLDTNYTFFDGSSAAAAQVSAVAALMLEARPDLSWRDIKLIMALTAQKNDPSGISWVQNGSPEGLNYSYLYGFGVVDAKAAVNAVKTWRPLPVQQVETLSGETRSKIMVTRAFKLEYVTVELTQKDWIDSSFVDISLTSPSGTTVKLMTARDCYKAGTTIITECAAALSGYAFGIAALLHETSYGEWKISIDGDDTNVLDTWEITLYGYDY